MSRSAIDVAIVGGGPAGAAAALTLARYTTRRCVLIEASRFDRLRLGECVSPAVLPLLAYLGVDPPRVPDEMIPCLGSEARWGRDRVHASASIFNQAGAGWALDRRAFDARLARRAQALGVTLIEGAALRRVVPQPRGWGLVVERDGVAETIVARQVVDASGRSAAFARRVGAATAARAPTDRTADDRLVAIVAHGRRRSGAPAAQMLRLESVPQGWWYMAALPSDRVVVALMTDADLVRADHATPAHVFADALQGSPAMRAWTAGFEAEGPPRLTLAGGGLLAPACGRDWIAAGDAACRFDPISSLGIGHALSSGIQAARISEARLAGDETLSRSYDADLVLNHAAYRARLSDIYAAERRWPTHAFWRRRQTADQAERPANPHAPPRPRIAAIGSPGPVPSPRG